LIKEKTSERNNKKKKGENKILGEIVEEKKRWKKI
jgi:hypothetical protein